MSRQPRRCADSPFSSETSATTPIGRVVSAVRGARTAVTTRSGRSRAIAARRNKTSPPVLLLRTCTLALTVAPRATGPSSISATPARSAHVPQHADRRPVCRDVNDTQRLDGRCWFLSVDLDPEQPALWPRERVDLERDRALRSRHSPPRAWPTRPRRIPMHMRAGLRGSTSLLSSGCACRLLRRDSDQETMRLHTHAALIGG